MPIYNLSISSVGGDPIYGVISHDKDILREFLREHDHEGSWVSLVTHNGDGDEFTELQNANVYAFLEKKSCPSK